MAGVACPSVQEEEVAGPFDLVGEVVGPFDQMMEVAGPSDLVGEAVGPSDLVVEVVGPSDLVVEVVGPSDQVEEVVGPFVLVGEVVGPFVLMVDPKDLEAGPFVQVYDPTIQAVVLTFLVASPSGFLGLVVDPPVGYLDLWVVDPSGQIAVAAVLCEVEGASSAELEGVLVVTSVAEDLWVEPALLYEELVLSPSDDLLLNTVSHHGKGVAL